jgi:6-phosphofructokinase
VFHVPKTIDNDLRVNDHCPGYGSAARYVACCFQGNDLDNRALPGVKIDVVMGRNAGWLTAAASLARMDATSGPHLIYVPERPVSLDDMARQIGEVHERLGRCLVAVSEGVRGTNGKVLLDSEAAEKDSHGNVQLSGSGALGDFIAQQVKERLKAKYPKLRLRTDTLGYAQRSFVGCTSEVDAREARMVGEAACTYAMRGDLDGTVAIHRLPGDDYAVEPTLVALKQVARVTREMPDEFLAPSGHDVTPAYVEYARPLVGKLPPVGLLADKRYKVK